MSFVRLLRARDWVPVLGYVVYIVALAAGYYYNLTFVQLGLVDLGRRVIGLSHREVSSVMAVLALVTVAVAVFAGIVLDRRGWSSSLKVKLRILVVVVGGQLVLTVTAPSLTTAAGLLGWVIACSVILGVGIPLMFSMMGDLVPVPDRGPVAAAVAGAAFFAAALFPFEWEIEGFSRLLAIGMGATLPILALAAFRRSAVIDQLARQTARLGVGRFCRDNQMRTASTTFWIPVVLMFGVFFIDSLGFLRIIEAPVLMDSSWQSTDLGVRVFIAVTHVVGAAMAGILYKAFDRGWLFVWIFGLFAFTHLLYTFYLRTGTDGDPPLSLPLFYVLAVSFYTTLNFALWPDLSTPQTIGLRTALGVGIAGWLASFSSTAVALYSEGAGTSLADHLNYVNALALLLLVGVPTARYLTRIRRLLREEAEDEPGSDTGAAPVPAPAEFRR